MKFSSIFEPQVVRQPLAQKISFCAIGMPVSAVALPAAMRASAASACASDGFRVSRDEGIESGVQLGDAFEVQLRQLDAGYLFWRASRAPIA